MVILRKIENIILVEDRYSEGIFILFIIIIIFYYIYKIL